MIYYVYVYLNKLKRGNFKYGDLTFEYEPFYVGKGNGDRYLHHLNKVKNNCKYKESLKFSIIKENLNNNLYPDIIEISDNLTEIDSLNLEKSVIEKIGRLDINSGPLTNLNDGGLKPQDNYHHSIDTKNKISISGRNRIPQDRYTLVSHKGDVFENINLFIFCTNNNLNYHKMRKSSNFGKICIRRTSIKNSKNKTLNCNGWTVINNKIYKERKRTIKYKLTNPDGDEIIIYNDQIAADVIKELKLDFRLLNLYRNRGKIHLRNINMCKKMESKNCEGWEFIDVRREKHTTVFESVRKLSWKITSPIGDVILIKNLVDFCNKNNLSDRTFRTFKNRGVINMKIQKNYSDNTIRCIGWSCETI